MTFYDQKFGTAPRPLKADVIVPKAPVAAAPVTKKSFVTAIVKKRTSFAYSALLTFSFLYYARPEDFIPGMAAIPVGKISGGLALAGLILGWGRMKGKMPLAIKLVLVLLVHMCITIPFSFWRGGAYDVVINQFSKAAMVALLISMIVSSVGELRRLLWVQAASVSVMTIASIVVHPTGPAGTSARLWGLGGVFSNPNDFAINIAINFPLCLAFFLGTKGVLKKLIWGVALLFLLYGVIATYSRSGLIAMLICFVICVWVFGIRGKRPQVIVAAIAVLFVGVGVAVSTPRYLTRLSTLIEGGDVQGSMDHGSLDARRELLMESIHVTLQHPLFGVGPGNFQAYTQSWHVTHNTYTELSSETGLPGLGLFLTILFLTFRSLKRVSETHAYENDPQIQLFTNALRAGLSAYIVGAAFASTSYTLFPYFMVAYVAALYKISSSPAVMQEKQPAGTSLNSRNSQNAYGKQEQQSLAWTR
jgi:O-antigen ligase